MAIESDVLVVGGGLAGMTAAIASADAGAKTRVVTHKESTLQQASGLVDLLGYVDDEEPISDPYSVIDALPANHPYVVLAESAIRDGFETFDAAVGDRYRGGHTDRNALVLTTAGLPKPTARYPKSVEPGLLSKPGDMLLVGFDTVTDFDAEYAAAKLDDTDVPFSVRGATIPFPGNFSTDAALTRLAYALDENELVTVDEQQTPIRDALTAVVEPILDDTDRVGFPAMLGRNKTKEVRSDLEGSLEVPVFEVPTGPPSLLGARLADGYEAAAIDAGVHVTRGIEVVDADIDENTVGTLTARYEHNTMEYTAEQYVLATGGLVGKGIESDRTSVTEPVFGCRVDHPADRYDWSHPNPFGPHRFSRFGVSVDEQLRPMADGVQFENVRAAGSVISGYDFAAECSGSGVSITTGHLAGALAASEGSS